MRKRFRIMALLGIIPTVMMSVATPAMAAVNIESLSGSSVSPVSTPTIQPSRSGVMIEEPSGYAGQTIGDSIPTTTTSTSDTVKTSSFDVSSTVSKDKAIVNSAENYYVKITWTSAKGSYKIGSDAYQWNGSKRKYEWKVNGQNSNVKEGGTAANTEITIENQSNAAMDYTITYTTATDTTTDIDTEETSSGTVAKQGTLKSFIAKNGINITNNTSGAAAIDYSSYKGDSITYKGNIKLKKFKLGQTSIENQTLGSYTVTIEKHTD